MARSRSYLAAKVVGVAQMMAVCVGSALFGACGPTLDSARASAPLAVAQDPAQLEARGTLTIAGRVGGPTLRVEVARSESERSRGLMYRRSLARDAGMLFCMGADADWSFWMRNTYLLLDLIFIDSTWTVVGVLAAVPPQNDQGRSVGMPSRYVLELAAHEAAVHGIVPGTRLVFADGMAAAQAARGIGR